MEKCRFFSYVLKMQRSKSVRQMKTCMKNLFRVLRKFFVGALDIFIFQKFLEGEMSNFQPKYNYHFGFNSFSLKITTLT